MVSSSTLRGVAVDGLGSGSELVLGELGGGAGPAPRALNGMLQQPSIAGAACLGSLARMQAAQPWRRAHCCRSAAGSWEMEIDSVLEAEKFR